MDKKVLFEALNTELAKENIDLENFRRHRRLIADFLYKKG